MFRIWIKTVKDNRPVSDLTISDNSNDSRTAKIVHALTKACREFDLAEPIWLETNIREFRSRRKTRFTHDNFIEEISFDYLEIQILEE